MSTIKSITPAEAKVTDHIKFRVISSKDLSVYTGTVVGIANYSNARMYNGDLAAEHLLQTQGAVIRGLGTLTDIKDQKFLIVECMDKVVRAFAFEWLMTTEEIYGYIQLIEAGKVYNIRLYDATSDDAAKATQLLRDAGYVVKLTTVE